MNTLKIFVNEQVVHEYDKATLLVDEQLAFLDQMDQDMEQGIKMHGQLIDKPDSQQRAEFVSLNLVKGLQQGNSAVISASCGYLSQRRPMTSEVHINDHEKGIRVEFVDELDS